VTFDPIYCDPFKRRPLYCFINNFVGHIFVGHIFVGHIFVGHIFVGHIFVGHIFVGHFFVGHFFVGHIFVDVNLGSRFYSVLCLL
jgi:hypothetical protein